MTSGSATMVAHAHARIERGVGILEDGLHRAPPAAAGPRDPGRGRRWPSKRMAPAVGRSSPRMSFDVVVLPQPDSPTTPEGAPRLERERDRVDRPDQRRGPAERAAPHGEVLGEPGDLEERRARHGAPVEPAARGVALGSARSPGAPRSGTAPWPAAQRGRERAPRRELREVGRLALDGGEAPGARAQAGNGLEQGARVGMGRRREDAPHGPQLHDAPGVHDGHACRTCAPRCRGCG